MQQWMAATVLAVIPLLVAISYAAFAFQQQTQKQQEMIEVFSLYSQQSNAVFDNAKELVRLARQYRLLNDASFLELFRQKAEELDTRIASLRSHLPESDDQRLLNSLAARMDGILTALEEKPAVPEKELSDELQALVNQSEALGGEINRYQQARIQAGEREFKRIVDQLFLFSVLALPGTFLIMVLGTYTVSRPIWRLSEAIHALGAQNWDIPIRIDGPSDLVALGENLEWMRQQVVRSEQQKTAFIQHVTHELKTPLAAIIEAGNLLNEEVSGPLRGEQREILGILRDNARNLRELIEQLLNYNAVSYGIMTQLRAVSPELLCDSIRRGLETAFPGKEIHWVFSGEPSEICSDSRLLEMILKNLMSNAIQFSPDGGEIRVHWEADEHQWRLTVSDQGPGIADDEIDKIFEPFFKGRTGREEKIPKNGIGLAIVHECVKLLKGQIFTVSELSKGTTFEIVFPLETSAPSR